jgi:hypothetical protein
MKVKVERQKGLKRGAFEEERQGRETREARDGREDKVERKKGLKRGALEEEGQGIE